MASFHGLIVTAASDCLQMRFSRLGLRPAESLAFATSAAEPAALVLAFPARDGRPGAVLQGQPWLVVRDRYGNTCEGAEVEGSELAAELAEQTTPVWHGLITRTSPPALSGASKLNITRGGARFTDLGIERVGNYRLVFRALALETVSDELVVVAGPARRLRCILLPDGILAGAPIQR